MEQVRTLELEGKRYVVLPEHTYLEMVENQIVVSSDETLTQAEIETRLGKPVDYTAWLDAYLMAESLQEKFASVIADFMHLEMKEESSRHPDSSKLERYKQKQNHFLDKKSEQYQLSLKEKQLLLIELIFQAREQDRELNRSVIK